MPGNIIVYKAIDDEGNSYWPDVFPIEVLQSWYNENGPISFSSQYQSSPVDLAGNFLKAEYLNYYNWIERPESFDIICFYVDPSTGEGSDYFVLAIAGKSENRIYLLDLIRSKVPLYEQADIIQDANSIWRPQLIVVEATGQQKYLRQHLEKTTLLNITDSDTKWTQSNKDTRFATCAAHMNSRKALLPGFRNSDGIWEINDSFNVFKNEWLSYPNGSNDDTLDAVSGVIESLITSIEVASVSEPEDVESAIEFIERVLQRTENSDRTLTDEERQALEDYYNEGFDMTIRRYGVYRGLY